MNFVSRSEVADPVANGNGAFFSHSSSVTHCPSANNRTSLVIRSTTQGTGWDRAPVLTVIVATRKLSLWPIALEDNSVLAEIVGIERGAAREYRRRGEFSHCRHGRRYSPASAASNCSASSTDSSRLLFALGASDAE